MREFAFAVPGRLTIPTGGYAYDRRIVAELATLGWHADVLDIGEGFPRPTVEERATACARLAAVPAGHPIVVDGLALGVLPGEARALRREHPLVALVHHPLALETGVAADEAEALRLSERAALACADRVVVTSPSTACLLAAAYGVAPMKVTVVRPGTDRVPVRPRPPADRVALLAVGAVVPRKGYDVLVAALAELSDLPWDLVIVGDRTRSRETVRRLDEDIDKRGLAGRIVFAGIADSDGLRALYASADLFVLPSRFEGYGMAIADAIAHGVPVVATTAGAIPDTVPPGSGVLVRPDDAQALAAALRRLIGDPIERERLAAGARAAASTLPTWRDSAALFAGVLDSIA